MKRNKAEMRCTMKNYKKSFTQKKGDDIYA